MLTCSSLFVINPMRSTYVYSPTPLSYAFKLNFLSQGVRHKFVAFEIQLTKYPPWPGKVVLIQVAFQTTEYNEIAAGGVTDVVSHINSQFSALTYQPVVFFAHAGFNIQSVFGSPDGGGCVLCVVKGGNGPRDAWLR